MNVRALAARPGRMLALWVGVLVVLLALVLYLLTLDNGLRPDELLGGDLITHHYSLTEIQKAFEAMESRQGMKIMVHPHGDSGDRESPRTE